MKSESIDSLAFLGHGSEYFFNQGSSHDDCFIIQKNIVDICCFGDKMSSDVLTEL